MPSEPSSSPNGRAEDVESVEKTEMHSCARGTEVGEASLDELSDTREEIGASKAVVAEEVSALARDSSTMVNAGAGTSRSE